MEGLVRNLRSLDLKLSLCVSALGHAIVFSIISLRGDGLAPRSQALMPGKETVLEIRLEQVEPSSREAQLAPPEPHPTASQPSGIQLADVPSPTTIADEPSERPEIVAVVRA